jgi:hypothetical protein
MEPKRTWTQIQAEQARHEQEAQQAQEALLPRLRGDKGRPACPEGSADRRQRARVAQATGEAVEAMLRAHVAGHEAQGRLDKIPTPVQIKRNLGPNASGAVEVYGELRQPVAPDFLGHWITEAGLSPLAIEAKSAQDTEDHKHRWALPPRLRLHDNPQEALRSEDEATRREAVKALLKLAQSRDKGRDPTRAAPKDGHQGLYLEDLARKGGLAAVFLWREQGGAQFLVPVHPESPHMPSLRAPSWAWSDLAPWEIPRGAGVAQALTAWRRYVEGGWASVIPRR